MKSSTTTKAARVRVQSSKGLVEIRRTTPSIHATMQHPG